MEMIVVVRMTSFCIVRKVSSMSHCLLTFYVHAPNVIRIICSNVLCREIIMYVTLLWSYDFVRWSSFYQLSIVILYCEVCSLTIHLSSVEAMECFVAFSFMALVAMMPPKKQAKEKPAKRGRDEDQESNFSETADKTNMLNQLKAAKRRLSMKTSVDEESDQFKSDLLDSYCKLSLRDPKKNEILKKWLNDKSCSWWASYSETTTVGTTWSHDTFKGYGTKCLSCLCVVL